MIKEDAHRQRTQNMCITCIQRRPNVFDVGPTLNTYFTMFCVALLCHSWPLNILTFYIPFVRQDRTAFRSLRKYPCGQIKEFVLERPVGIPDFHGSDKLFRNVLLF